ncbi:MAG: hypothetical protein WA913_07675 [Pricia sp.]
MITASTSAKNYLTRWVGFSKKPNYRYRLVDFKNKRHKTDMLLSQTRCNLEILKEGVMVIGEFSEEDTIIPVLKDEIETIILVRGKEVIDTFYLSPMHILSKLGVPHRISRFLSFFPWEYTITETRITIRCQDQQLKLITSGHSFEKLSRIFKNLGYADTLDSIEKPSLNVLNYSA